MLKTTWLELAAACCLAVMMYATSSAGILNGHPDALPGWSGSVPFDNGLGLKGDLDYAVFTAADFNASFSGLGYVPGDALVYSYQLLNSGTDQITAEIVGILNPANTIGTFDIGDVDASTAAFVGTNATWFFNPGIATGQSSWGLAYSSPNLPMSGAGLTVDGGASVLVVGIPTPSDIPIPEPTSLAIAASLGSMMYVLRQRRT